jgi:hypothetical protein
MIIARVLFILTVVGGLCWLIAAGSNAIWPEAKWVFIAIFLLLVVIKLTRQFLFALNQGRELLEVYKKGEIVAVDLPAEFRFIRHETTVKEVIEKLGPYSCVTEVGKARAFQYDLPSRAAVIVFPEHADEADSPIRAVCLRDAINDSESVV